MTDPEFKNFDNAMLSYKKTGFVLVDFENQSAQWNQWAPVYEANPVFYDMDVTNADAHSGSYCGVLSFDTVVIDGDSYLNSWLPGDALPPDGSTTLKFWTKTEKTIRFYVRLVDDTGQTHQRNFTQSPGVWEQKSYSLLSPWSQHWGGDNDGVIYWPVKQLQILCYSDTSPVSGNIYIDDFEVLTTAAEQDIRDDYWADIVARFDCNNVPGNLFHVDQVDGRVSVTRPPFDDIALEITGNVYDAEDNLVAALTPVELNSTNSWGADIVIPDELGYYRINMTATDISVPANTAVVESRYGVIVPNDAMGVKELDSPFGVNTHFGQWWGAPIGEVVKRAGIGWVRDGDNISRQSALYICKRNNLSYMTVLNSLGGGIVPMFVDTLATDPDFPRSGPSSWDYTCAWEDGTGSNPCFDILAQNRNYAATYGDDIDAYNLWNEPTNFGNWDDALGGGWWGGEWTETFADYGNQIAAEIRSQDPNAPIVWDDIDYLGWYDEFYGHGVTDSADIISPHPYSATHMDENPEKQPMIPGQDTWLSFLSNNNLDWEIWSGEVGDSTSTGTEGWHRHVTEIEQAYLLVRMMTVQLEWGVKKIFYYDFMNDGSDPDSTQDNFGIMLGGAKEPKPAVVAYSYLISRIKGYDVLERLAIGSANAYVYEVLRGSDDTFLMASTLNGIQEVINIPVNSAITEVTIRDIFGTNKGTVPVIGGSVSITATESPVYIDGLEMADFYPAAAALTRHWKLDETGTDTTAIDATGNQDGTLVGTPDWTTGQIDGGLRFDGTTNYVTAGSNTLGDDFTITAWIKRDNASSDRVIFSQYDSSTSGSFMFYVANGKLRVYQDGGPLVTGSTPLTVDQWYHAAFVKDGSSGTAYLDGNPEITGISNMIAMADLANVIGAHSTGANFDGVIDDVRIYDGALTQASINGLISGGSISGPAINPIPYDGDSYASGDVVLSWTPDIFADSHDVYFGTDFNDVNDATIPLADTDKSGTVDILDLQLIAAQWLTDPGLIEPSADLDDSGRVDMVDFATTASQWLQGGIYQGSQTGTTYDPDGTLTPGTYYWRIDEVNSLGLWKGSAWQFTVPAP
ncbi:MAG: hypothetical protein DRP56_03595 [Planctomycetota bacterium]|nr:MAG: hypothetical protein DRP56_03595 [Planctomycetota bacterium]